MKITLSTKPRSQNYRRTIGDTSTVMRKVARKIKEEKLYVKILEMYPPTSTHSI